MILAFVPPYGPKYSANVASVVEYGRLPTYKDFVAILFSLPRGQAPRVPFRFSVGIFESQSPGWARAGNRLT